MTSTSKPSIHGQPHSNESTSGHQPAWIKPFLGNVIAGITASILYGTMSGAYTRAADYMKNLDDHFWWLSIALITAAVGALIMGIYCLVRFTNPKPHDKKGALFAVATLLLVLFAGMAALIVVAIPYHIAISSNQNFGG